MIQSNSSINLRSSESDNENNVHLPEINQNHDDKYRYFSPFQRNSTKNNNPIKDTIRYQYEAENVWDNNNVVLAVSNPEFPYKSK